MSPAVALAPISSSQQERVLQAVLRNISRLRLGVDKNALYGGQFLLAIVLGDSHRIPCNCLIPPSLLHGLKRIPKNPLRQEHLARWLDRELALVPIEVTATVDGLQICSTSSMQLPPSLDCQPLAAFAYEWLSRQIVLSTLIRRLSLRMVNYTLAAQFCPFV